MKTYISFLILLYIFNFSYHSDKLVFLYTHYRHGARGPGNFINKNLIDTMGQSWTAVGELTGVGERMHYLLGLRNRQKYIEEEKLLSEKFDPHQMLIYSTDVNRTIVSCASQLQGWYPQRAHLGEVLTDEQKEKAYPPILEEKNKRDEYIENATNELEHSALPYRMMLAPIRVINENENGIEYKIPNPEKCQEKITQMINNNIQNNKEFQNSLNNFIDKYAEKIYNYTKYEINKNNVGIIGYICDDFICDYTDDRNLTELEKKAKINIQDFKNDCIDFMEKYFHYVYNGDEDKILAIFQTSGFMKELLFYMKRRLDANMTEEDEDANYADYSRPRMLMKSGHDTTVTFDLFYFIKALDLNETEIYKYPTFASQLAVEVRTNKDNCKNYSDYYIVCYYNNKTIFNMTADEFIYKVNNTLITEAKIKDYCGIEENDNTDNKSNDDKTDTTQNTYKMLLIILISLCSIFLVIIIILACKLSKKKDSWISPIEQNLVPYEQDNIDNHIINK